jgi:RNA polymerase sigma-70 factor (ECF subfamily)
MTARAGRKGHTVGGSGDRTEEFEELRGHLHTVARRILGSAADADDAVQETWLRLRRTDTEHVVNLPGWLTTVVSRICLDQLRARRARPETPAGQHPAPVAYPEGNPPGAGPPGLNPPEPNPPEHSAVLADSVGRTLLLVLDTLGPAERVAFVLHDVFAVPFADIAGVIGRSPEATKKLAGRARRRVQLGRAASSEDLAAHRRLVETFLAALRRADIEAVVALLAPDVVRRVDDVLLPVGVPATVRGARAIAEEARTLSKPAWAARPALVNGSVGAVVDSGRKITLAVLFRFAAGTIAEFHVVGDPAHLATLEIDSL